jgi:hypothetical protein
MMVEVEASKHLCRANVVAIASCNAMLASSFQDVDCDTSAFAVIRESPVHCLCTLGESLKDLRTSDLKRVPAYEIDLQLFVGSEMEGGHSSFRGCQIRHAVDPRVPVPAIKPWKTHRRSELAMQRHLIVDDVRLDSDRSHRVLG